MIDDLAFQRNGPKAASC